MQTYLQNARRFLASLAAQYTRLDEETTLIRGAHLNSVVRLTPHTMLANVGSASLILWAFRTQLSVGLLAWWLALLVTSGGAVSNWYKRRARTRTKASIRSVHMATVHAAILSGVWAIMLALWFPQATSVQQLVIATLATGMLGAGTFVLNPLPAASMVYALFFWGGSLAALVRTGNPELVSVMALLALYGPVVMLGSLFSWRKATDLLISQAAALQQERLLSVVLKDFEQHADDALWEVDASGRISHHSPRLGDLLGISVPLLPGLLLTAHLEARAFSGLAELKEALQTALPFRSQVISAIFAGETRHLSVSAKPLGDSLNKPSGWRGVMTDITLVVKADQQLKRLAHTDTLTGLANRFTLLETMESVLFEGEFAALLLVDLDHFKAVNDSLGHAAGDDLLKIVAEHLLSNVREHDLVARLGGDEFAILMSYSASPAAATALAERIVDATMHPMEVHGRKIRVGASIGIAFCEDAATTPAELLVQADIALYASKEAGRSRHTLFSFDLGEQNRRKRLVEEGLRVAVERQELQLHWQPKLDIARWEITGAEALLRWQSPHLGTVNPTEFIAVAEECGLIAELGNWALREACRVASDQLWGITVSVNVSPLQFNDRQLVRQVLEALRESGLSPFRLELEITESVFVGDVHAVLEQLHALRTVGVKIALDDFGTGYSSLAYLRQFPFNTLKIDRSFVNDILEAKEDKAIVGTIAQLAGLLGMRTVAEGVETVEQYDAVAQANCDEIQGYLISPPVPLGAFSSLWKHWRTERPEALTRY